VRRFFQSNPPPPSQRPYPLLYRNDPIFHSSIGPLRIDDSRNDFELFPVSPDRLGRLYSPHLRPFEGLEGFPQRPTLPYSALGLTLGRQPHLTLSHLVSTLFARWLLRPPHRINFESRLAPAPGPLCPLRHPLLFFSVLGSSTDFGACLFR